MLMKTPSITQNTARETSCAYCGSDAYPMRGKDLRQHTGQTWRLASACIDSRACAQRARERDQHLDQRWALTPAGRQVIEEITQPLPAA